MICILEDPPAQGLLPQGPRPSPTCPAGSPAGLGPTADTPAPAAPGGRTSISVAWLCPSQRSHILGPPTATPHILPVPQGHLNPFPVQGSQAVHRGRASHVAPDGDAFSEVKRLHLLQKKVSFLGESPAPARLLFKCLALQKGNKVWFLKTGSRASLVAQWLRICLLMQGTRVRALAWEDPTCRRAAGPVSHNC